MKTIQQVLRMYAIDNRILGRLQQEYLQAPKGPERVELHEELISLKVDVGTAEIQLVALGLMEQKDANYTGYAYVEES